MDIFILLIIVTLIGTYIYWPYRVSFEHAHWQQNGQTRKESLRELEDARDSLLQTIKDLEFDHEAGKLSSEDFKELNIIYRQKAVKVLKSIDVIRSGRELPATKVEAKPVCPSCSRPIPKSARFCSHCGTPVV